MSEYIIDTSIVIQVLIQDQYTTQVRNLFRRLVAGDKLYIPEFCLLECANVMWKRVRFNALPPNVAKVLLDDLLALPFTTLPLDDVLQRALQIGLEHKLAVYDSLYIAFAEQYQFPLITADTRQETAASAVGVTIKPITDFQ